MAWDLVAGGRLDYLDYKDWNWKLKTEIPVYTFFHQP